MHNKYKMNKSPRTNNLDRDKVSKKNALTAMYEKILRKFEKEEKKIKATYSNQAFDDTTISSKRKIFPVLNIQSPKKVKRKFYSNKMIANDIASVNDRREATYHQMMTDFKKLSIPSPYVEQGNLNERNRRIKELYERAERNADRESPDNKIKFIKHIQNPNQPEDSTENQQALPPRDIPIKTGDKKMSDILREAKERRNKLELPSLRGQRSKSSIIIHEISPQQCVQEKPLVGEKMQVKSPDKKTELQKVKRETKIKASSQRKLFIDLPQRSSQLKIFNWKKQIIPLCRIEREDFMSLIRFYLNIGAINPIPNGFYRAYIGPGNNCTLIKKTLKERGYWTIVDSLSDNPHFVWTQLRCKKFVQKLSIVKNTNQYADAHDLIAQQPQSPAQAHELSQFLRSKRNDYIMACEKLLETTVYRSLFRDIMHRFKLNGHVRNLNKLKPEIISKYRAISYQVSEEETEAGESYLHNHVQNAGSIGDKKGLLYFITKYAEIFDEDLDQLVPTTVHLQDSEEVDQIFDLIPDGPWILKPGQATNRGIWITVHTSKESLLAQISKKRRHKNGEKYTSLVQKYIDPLLYNNRKFDIRVWVLWNGRQAWWYQEGYIRTASKQYSLKNTNKFVHLTNDAIQCQCQQYGKFEQANKVSYNQLQKYLETHYGYRYFTNSIMPQMKQQASKAFRMGNLVMDPSNSKHCFELFGLDFLVDSQFKPWLIQCNANPCLDVNCSLLARLVPNMINNVLNLTADVIFPAPARKKSKQEPWCQENFKFELLFDGTQDVELRQKLLTKKINVEYKGQYQQFIQS